MRLTVTTENVDQDNFIELQRAYNSCIAETDIKKVGITPIQTILTELSSLLGANDSTSTMPLQPKDTKGISEAILYLESLDISNFFSLGVGPDDKNPVGNFECVV
jgi:endothelin-converting enzyme